MQILKVNAELPFGVFTLDAGSCYVFSDQLAEEIKIMGNSRIRGSVETYDILFEHIYREYDGRPLDGKKLFLWRTGGAGDLLFMTPVLRELKTRYPTCEITLSCDGRYVDLLVDHPYLDNVIAYPVKLDYLEEADYHLCFEALIEQNPDATRKHAVDLFMEKFGIRSLPDNRKRPMMMVSDEAIDATDELFENLGIKPDEFVVGVQYRVDAPIRHYPTEYLIQAAHALSEYHGAKVIWFGSPMHAADIDNQCINRYQKQDVFINLPKHMSGWQESAAVMAKCDVAISADSATVHLAGTHKYTNKGAIPEDSKYVFNRSTPLVGIYGPFLPETRIKYYHNSVAIQAEVGCAGCSQHGYDQCRLGWPSPCFQKIGADTIVAATMRLMAQLPGRVSDKEIYGINEFKMPYEEWIALNEKVRRNPFEGSITSSSPLQPEI